MKPEFDLTKMVEEISMQAKETQEEFIFETIQPYCENILQMKINKGELKRILLNGIQKTNTGHWIDIMVGDMPAQACDRCNTFYPLSYTGGGHRYCPNCGAKMEVDANANSD